jgi:hypothetical protein
MTSKVQATINSGITAKYIKKTKLKENLQKGRKYL